MSVAKIVPKSLSILSNKMRIFGRKCQKNNISEEMLLLDENDAHSFDL